MERAAEDRGFFEQLAAFELKTTATSFVWPLALAVAWAFDLLFWAKKPGISFPVFVTVLLICGYAVARSASVSISNSAKWLLLPLAVFSVGPAIRAEPLTMILDCLAVVLLLGLLVDTLINGGLLRYRVTDFIVAFVHLALAGLVRGGFDIAERGARQSERAHRRYEPVMRGALLALPLLLAFGLLFASADLVFSRLATSPFRSLDPEKIAEYAFRLFYVMVLGYVLTGFLLYAVRPARTQEDEFSQAIATRRRGLGMVEGSVVLGSLTGLFGLFVAIQFRYFFAGSGAINDLGMTYSQYARKGFGELVAVAVLTLVLLVSLSLIVRRDSQREHVIFSSLSSGLVVLTAVILVSAFQRLLAYEDAYGFTRLRTYSHVLMVWLGLTLVAALVLQWKNSLRSMALVLILVGLGFVASLNVMGVDAFIARNNIDRAVHGSKFDALYLDELSTDAVPTLVARVDELPEAGRTSLSNVLVCKALDARKEKVPWQSIRLSHIRARSALERYYERVGRGKDAPTCGPLALRLRPL